MNLQEFEKKYVEILTNGLAGFRSVNQIELNSSIDTNMSLDLSESEGITITLKEFLSDIELQYERTISLTEEFKVIMNILLDAVTDAEIEELFKISKSLFERNKIKFFGGDWLELSKIHEIISQLISMYFQLSISLEEMEIKIEKALKDPTYKPDKSKEIFYHNFSLDCYHRYSTMIELTETKLTVINLLNKNAQ